MKSKLNVISWIMIVAIASIVNESIANQNRTIFSQQNSNIQHSAQYETDTIMPSVNGNSDSIFHGIVPSKYSYNSPPSAFFFTNNITGLCVEFDGTRCTDIEDPLYNLKVRWDFDNDGAWDTDWSLDKIDFFQYKSEGEYMAKIEVKDTENLSNEYSMKVNVNNKNDLDSLNQVGIEWIYVSGGTFQMGANDGHSTEKPEHTVTLKGFEIAKYEVTNSQYCKFLNSSNCNEKGESNEVNFIYLYRNDIRFNNGRFKVIDGRENRPVANVTWLGAKAFAEWVGGRLPTEAEWEFAAKGGMKSKGYKYSGSNSIGEVAWNRTNSVVDNRYIRHDVGTKAANELGIYDMSGNAYEWCSDWYKGDFYSDPLYSQRGPTKGYRRVMRGGAMITEYACRVVNRDEYDPDLSYAVGFRIVR